MSGLVRSPARFRLCALSGEKGIARELALLVLATCGSCELSPSPAPHTFHFNLSHINIQGPTSQSPPYPHPSIRRVAEARGPSSPSVCGRQEEEGVQGTGQGLLAVRGNSHPFKPLRNCFLPSRSPVTKAT